MKTVLFIPGFAEDIHSRNYAATLQAIKSKGYNVQFVSINWKRKTIIDWVAELEKVYAKYDPWQTVLAGFSYGAMTAFVAATKHNPSELWLFSLSPYFAEDLQSKNMKQQWLKNIGKRRATTFGQLNFAKLAKGITCKTLLFVGQFELDMWPVMAERSIAAPRFIADSKLTIIPDVGHDVADSKYIAAISNLM